MSNHTRSSQSTSATGGISDEDFNPVLSNGAPVRKKRKPGRGAVACLQCRAKKLACDLKSPCCTSCENRGDHSCSLSNLLWYDNPSDTPAYKLRASVDRLEALVHKIKSSSSSHSPTTSSESSACSSPGLSRASRRTTRGEGEVLMKLLLVGVGDLGVVPTMDARVDFQGLLSELIYLTPPPTPLPLLASPLSPQTPLQNLLQIMPTKPQASLCIDSYFSSSSSHSHSNSNSYCEPLLHKERFLTQCESFWREGLTPVMEGGLGVDWLGGYLAVCGLGLLGLVEEGVGGREKECGGWGEEEIRARDTLPRGEGRELLGRSWLDGALQALYSSEFLKSPSLDSIRTVVLLNQFWGKWGSGRYLFNAISFNSPVLGGCWELDLHIDPEEIERDFKPLEAEERRRVFWALFTQDTLARTFLQKSYSPISPSSITTKFPSSSPDEAFTTTGNYNYSFISSSSTSSTSSTPTSSSGGIHELVFILSKVNNFNKSKLMGGGEERVLREELREWDERNSGDEGLLVRGLRGFVGVRLGEGWESEADKLLNLVPEIQRCCSMGEEQEGMLFTVLSVWSAGIALGVDLLERPYSTSVESTKSRLLPLISILDYPQWPIDIARILQRGSIILRHVLAHTTTFVNPSSSSLPPPIPAYFSHSGNGQGHSRNGSASSGSTFEHSLIGTPPAFLLPSSFEVQSSHRRTSEQSSSFFSPMPSDQSLASFADTLTESYYGSPPPTTSQPLRTLSLGINTKLPFDLTKGEYEGPSPLLKPWLVNQFRNSGGGGSCFESWGWNSPTGSSQLLRDLFA